MVILSVCSSQHCSYYRMHLVLAVGSCCILLHLPNHPMQTHYEGLREVGKGYLIAIVTFGSTEHGGKNDKNCLGYSPSVVHIPPLLDVTTWSEGADSITSIPQQQRQRQGSRGGWGDYSYMGISRYNFPTLA